MEYIIIAESGYIPELQISVRKDQRFKIGHPFIQKLIPYSTTPHLLEELASINPASSEMFYSDNDRQQQSYPPAKPSELSAREIEELRQMAKEAGIKQWKNMKIENIIKKLEDLNNE